MFCKYCGKEIDDDAVFCKYCGKNLSDDPDDGQRQTQTRYQQQNPAGIPKAEIDQMDKVLAQNFAVDSGRGVIMETRFHAAVRFPASILLLITAAFFIVISFIVLISYHSPWALYVISWILVIAALIYFIICTLRITRSVFAVTDTQLLINTWMPSQKLTIPLDQIERADIDVIPFYRNEYGDLRLTANGKTYDFHQIYKPNEFRDALMRQINKTQQI